MSKKYFQFVLLFLICFFIHYSDHDLLTASLANPSIKTEALIKKKEKQEKDNNQETFLEILCQIIQTQDNQKTDPITLTHAQWINYNIFFVEKIKKMIRPYITKDQQESRTLFLVLEISGCSFKRSYNVTYEISVPLSFIESQASKK